jgi:hypothetical protein
MMMKITTMKICVLKFKYYYYLNYYYFDVSFQILILFVLILYLLYILNKKSLIHFKQKKLTSLHLLLKNNFEIVRIKPIELVNKIV